jgi:aminoglycoside phosphotransferase (APT) family kinase protein
VSHAETEITAELVRDLLRDQHPDLADFPVTLGARGWDNQLWRLGDRRSMARARASGAIRKARGSARSTVAREYPASSQGFR